MNAGEIAKIYSMYPDQQQADTALQTTLRNDFGYTGALPQSVLGAIDPSIARPAAPPALSGGGQLTNPQTPPATSNLMPPSVVPQPVEQPRTQESWGMPSGQVQQTSGASRQQPSQSQGRGNSSPQRPGIGGLQELLQMAMQLRQRGLLR